jgi:hypothetical protein
MQRHVSAEDGRHIRHGRDLRPLTNLKKISILFKNIL